MSTAASTSTAPTPEQRLFDVKDATAYLVSIGARGATVSFVRTLISSAQVPHLRIGKKFYVSRASLDRWLETRERRAR
jgi:Helix-turn-helix domain